MLVIQINVSIQIYFKNTIEDVASMIYKLTNTKRQELFSTSLFFPRRVAFAPLYYVRLCVRLLSEKMITAITSSSAGCPDAVLLQGPTPAPIAPPPDVQQAILSAKMQTKAALRVSVIRHYLAASGRFSLCSCLLREPNNLLNFIAT